MLREIHVRNLAVLAEASVEFGQGLNVLSGETGAGKSIVVDSLSLLAGARSSAEMVRTGAETLTVSGVFEPEGDGW
ncbi:MAG TPA: AAA family ATPase, partial [Thermoanaerobaculia bacterium]|nr:AAA family ATPase [Thermoanaerobaculia bacterium]